MIRGMLFFDGGFGFLLLGLWVFCLIDVITTDEARMRNLSKPWWLLIVLLFSDIGSVLWLVAGRPWEGSRVADLPYRGSRSSGAPTAARFPEYDRPGRFTASNPDDDEDFLAGLRARAEEQRRRYREQQREQERRDQRDGA